MFGLKSLCHKFSNTHIQLQIDNTTAVCFLQNFGGCRSQPYNNIARSIWLWCIEKQLWITASHLPGSENIAADSKSRIFDDTRSGCYPNPYLKAFLQFEAHSKLICSPLGEMLK